MKASDIMIGAAIAAVVFLAYQAMKPAPKNPPASSPSSSSGGNLLGSLLNPIGQTVATRLNEALDGEREWW